MYEPRKSKIVLFEKPIEMGSNKIIGIIDSYLLFSVNGNKKNNMMAVGIPSSILVAVFTDKNGMPCNLKELERLEPIEMRGTFTNLEEQIKRLRAGEK